MALKVFKWFVFVYLLVVLGIAMDWYVTGAPF